MTKEYYTVLHGAKKNVGDFLIKDRSIKLLSHIRNDRNLIEFPSWEKLDNHLEIINKSKALIIMGGPGVSYSTYPGSFPLTRNLDDIKVPIVFMGTGSYVFPISSIDTYQLSNDTIALLKKCEYISVRDIITKTILINNGITNSIVSGCPAWYDINKIGHKLDYNKEIKTIILSSPQKKIFFPQFLELCAVIKNKFKDAKIIITFNRGFKKDEYTSDKEVKYMKYYSDKLIKNGFEVVDLSKNLAEFLDHLKYDIHIGYRLHTHINFISHRKPSYLIAEDSRSYGNYKTLSVPGWIATKSGLNDIIVPTISNDFLRKVFNKIIPAKTNSNFLMKEIIDRLDYDIKHSFSSFSDIDRKIDSNYQVMKNFLEKLP